MLLAVNPYKSLRDLYGEETMAFYERSSLIDTPTASPDASAFVDSMGGGGSAVFLTQADDELDDERAPNDDGGALDML